MELRHSITADFRLPFGEKRTSHLKTSGSCFSIVIQVSVVCAMKAMRHPKRVVALCMKP
jgi:hypothetical protein